MTLVVRLLDEPVVVVVVVVVRSRWMIVLPIPRHDLNVNIVRPS